MVYKKIKQKWEYGDFQTPYNFAYCATNVIKNLSIQPKSVVEPTCGRGTFIMASIESFPQAQCYVGVDINNEHLNYLREQIINHDRRDAIKILHADFFRLNWNELLRNLPEPILFLGNPPWVTSSELGTLQSTNLPQKSNFQGYSGIEALTGKSNFDISEWMLLKQLEWLQDREGIIAMLCKTSVARKVLSYIWKHNLSVSSSQIYYIDTSKHFNVSVDACFFILEFARGYQSRSCDIYESLTASAKSQSIGYYNELVVADVANYNKWRHLLGTDNTYIWRSGAKHDCSKIMELEKNYDKYRNGNGVILSLEDTYIYPLFKSSDIANGSTQKCRKYMLVTQKNIGEDTTHIQTDAPKTWQYLQENAEVLSKRSSFIYRNRPPFSIFGVGDYTFAPWKVAISGFYKKLDFKVLGIVEKRPAIFDDTIYFLPFWSQQEARFIEELLNSNTTKEFLSSMIFWSDKRPITIDLLKRLNMRALASELGREEEYQFYRNRR